MKLIKKYGTVSMIYEKLPVHPLWLPSAADTSGCLVSLPKSQAPDLRINDSSQTAITGQMISVIVFINYVEILHFFILAANSTHFTTQWSRCLGFMRH